MGRFSGKVVLLTGATGGFGRRIAERFAADGARLVLSDRREKPLAALAQKLPGEPAALAGDIAEERLHKNLVKLALARFGRLDIAVNNAGIAQSFVRLHQVPIAEARKIIDVDLVGVFLAMKFQLHAMEKQFATDGSRGAIVNISSIAGTAGAPHLSVYSAAKHGVIGLSRSAALEYATRGIRVNAVCPSFARTDMAMEFLRRDPAGIEQAEAQLTRGVPMKRLAEIDEVVEAVLFAADPANSFMTGQAIGIDGGIGAM
ncbi:MAG: SDR family oxidoreductase [Rhizobiaceae bacterium]